MTLLLRCNLALWRLSNNEWEHILWLFPIPDSAKKDPTWRLWIAWLAQCKKRSNMAAVNSVTCTIWLLWRHLKTPYRLPPQSRVIMMSHKQPVPAVRLLNLNCIKNHFVHILVTAMIPAILSHSELLISQPLHECFYISRMNRRIAIWPMFVAEYFPQFWGNWKWLSLQS